MEIELKLLVPPAALAALGADPLLKGVKAKHKAPKRLDNIYFDTPERALAQARVALRLRKDGSRWLQTVKRGGTAQAGLHSREEVEFAVAGMALEWRVLAGTPLGKIIDPYRAQLQPQFRTRFSREVRLLTGRSGAEIELAIDHGEIIAGKRREALCELELELKSGAVDDLFELALELVARHPLVVDNRSKAERGHALARQQPPGPPVKAAEMALPSDTDAPSLARQAIENCLAQWQANEPGFLAQQNEAAYDSEYLHQLRVALRRLRVACDPLARLAGWHADALASIKGPLRQLGQQLGEARDWDVFALETWPVLLADMPGDALRLALQEVIDIERALAHRRAQAALHSRGAQRVLLQLSRCLAEPPSATAPPTTEGESLNDQLDAYERKLRHGLPDLHELKPEPLHELRIIAKKLRYLTEFAAGLHEPEAVQRWLKWLKKAQEVLGARNDRATAEARIGSLCQAIDPLHGKVKRGLRASLQKRALPELDLPPLPAPYWR